jgi:hypothetical protein
VGVKIRVIFNDIDETLHLWTCKVSCIWANMSFILTPAGGFCLAWFIYHVLCYFYCPEIGTSSIHWLTTVGTLPEGQTSPNHLKKLWHWIMSLKFITVLIYHHHKLICMNSCYIKVALYLYNFLEHIFSIKIIKFDSMKHLFVHVTMTTEGQPNPSPCFLNGICPSVEAWAACPINTHLWCIQVYEKMIFYYMNRKITGIMA